MEKSSISSVSRVFVLLLIALVTVGGLAGGAAAWDLTIDFDGPYGPNGEDSLTYTGKGDADADSFWINRPVNSGGDITDSRLMYGQNPGTPLTISPREGYHVDGIYDESETPAKKLFDGNGYVVGHDNNKYLIYNPPGTQGEFYNFYENYPTNNGVTLKVKWVANTTNINLDVGSGSTSLTNGKISTGEYGITFDQQYIPPTPPLGYRFYGWDAYDSNNDLWPIADGDESAEKLMLSWAIEGQDNYFKTEEVSTDQYNWTSLVNDETVTLYANWIPILPYINFHPNEGNFTDTDTRNAFIECKELNDLTYLQSAGHINEVGDSKITVMYNYQQQQRYNLSVAREGFTFKGWTAVKDDPDTIIVTTQSSDLSNFPLQKETYTDTAQSFEIKEKKWYSTSSAEEPEVTLYAYWEPIPEEEDEPVNDNNAAAILSSTSKYRDSTPVEYCYVSFDANGGAGVMEPQQFTVGEQRALNLNALSNADHTFSGWALEPLGTVVYTDGQEITVSEDTTLYAVWGIPEIEDVPVEEPASPLGILGILGGLGAVVVLRRR